MCILCRPILRPQLRSRHETILQRLNGLLSVEALPFTLNQIYLKEYKDKVLAHYRDIWQRLKGEDTIVHRACKSQGTVATQPPRISGPHRFVATLWTDLHAEESLSITSRGLEAVTWHHRHCSYLLPRLADFPTLALET